MDEDCDNAIIIINEMGVSPRKRSSAAMEQKLSANGDESQNRQNVLLIDAPLTKPTKLPHRGEESTCNTTFSTVTTRNTGGANIATTSIAEMTHHTVSAEENVDENLYSRMLYVIGTEGLKRLSKSAVLVYGLDGLGAEIAKNIVLGGLSRVLLCDAANVELTDLGSQFFCREDDVGRNRAEVTRNRVAELNNYVTVECHNGFPTTEMADSCDVIILSNAPFNLEKQWGEYCHTSKIHFISVRSCGLTGRIFVDFGEDFTVIDPHGATPVSNIVLSVTNDKEGVVTVADEQRHGYEDGTLVRFGGVKGMKELQRHQPFKVKVIGPYTFSIGDTSEFSAFDGTAEVTEIISPVQFCFKSLAESIKTPSFVEYDFAKLEYPAQLHLAFLALSKFQEDRTAYPSVYDEKDALALLEFAKQINAEMKIVDEISEDVVMKFAKTCNAQLAPIHAFIGGIASQEVMKAITHKFSPIRQFFYFESFECMPNPMPQTPFDLSGHQRYHDEIAIFGSDFVQCLLKCNMFIVGMGAIGCELLKNFALMGVACGQEGAITITDMDTIGKSNLNRQFLFRPWDISKMKTNVAAASIKQINPSINIKCHQNKVGVETEAIYDDGFFNRLDCVVNALDNVGTRTYVDLRCVYYQKPLLESGTLGTRANTQVVLPHLTESYSSSQDPPEKSIPICTLKNFPHAIEHTIQWARDSFEELFFLNPLNASNFISDPVKFVADMRQQNNLGIYKEAQMVIDMLTNPLRTFEDCVTRARAMFDEYFVNQIKQLLFNFPPDMETSKGLQFWFAPKRCPHPLEYDHSVDTHAQFVYATANLLAKVYGIEHNTCLSTVLSIADKVELKPFTPRSGVKIASTEAEAESGGTDHVDKEKIMRDLLSLEVPENLRIESQEFEKDDDTNYHLEFITACSNLRALNYDIEPADMLKTKLIAGKIIPAIATTTSAVVGLVALEFIKLMQGKNAIEHFRNGFFDLADASFVFSEPVPAKINKYRDVEYTLWDRIDIEGDITLGEFLEIFKTKYKMTVTMMSHNVMLLYAFFMSKDKMAERRTMTIKEIIETVQKQPTPKHLKALVIEITADDIDTGEELEVPYIRYLL